MGKPLGVKRLIKCKNERFMVVHSKTAMIIIIINMVISHDHCCFAENSTELFQSACCKWSILGFVG